MDNEKNVNSQSQDVTIESAFQKEQLSKEEEKAIRQAEKEELKKKKAQEKESERIKRNVRKNEKQKEKKKKSKIRNSKLMRIFNSIKKAFITTAKIVLTPVTAVTSTIVYALSPKELKQQMYQDSLKEKQQELIDKEKAKEISKPAQKELTKKQKAIDKILSDKALNNKEKIEKLVELRNKSKFDFYVMTEKGVLQFGKNDKDVLIKHAIPEQPTAESKTVYGFTLVGGATIKGASKEFRNTFDVAQIVDKEGGFSKEQPGLLPENVIVENKENYGTPENTKDPLNVDIDSKSLDEAIAENDIEKIESEIEKVLENESELNPDINSDIPENPSNEEYDFFADGSMDQHYQNEQVEQADAFTKLFEENNIAPAEPEKNAKSNDDYER